MLRPELPGAPAAVLLFNPAGEAGCLAADFDVKRGGAAQVAVDAAGFAALITSCGGRSVTDESPNGGRHVYVFWSRPVPIADLRPVLRSLCLLYPSLDAAPMYNATAGCIRPPGARHRSGGHQRLLTPLPQAQAALEQPCGPGVWNALLERLAPHLDDHDNADGADPGETTPPAVGVGVGRPRRALPARLARIAETGLYPTERYPSPSEARQAVITGAAVAGWALADVQTAIAAGRWPGLAGLYARYRPAARQRAIRADWKKALAHLDRKKNDRNSPTRAHTHTGGTGGPHSMQSRPGVVNGAVASDYQWIRSWYNAVHALERSARWTGRAGLSTRVVLRALGSMAQKTGTRHLAVGRRALALACGLDDSTVGAVLRRLRAEPDPVLELLEPGRGEQADLYVLRIPDAALEVAAWRAWRAGNIGVHPVFRTLGPAAALTYEALTSDPLPRRDLIRDAALAPHTLDEALHLLAEHGLAERDPQHGWRRGARTLAQVGQALGIPALVASLVERYRRERTAWRAFLDAIRPGPTHHDPGQRTLWPTHLHAPTPADDNDDLYDAELGAIGLGIDPVTAAIELIQRELGGAILIRPG